VSKVKQAQRFDSQSAVSKQAAVFSEAIIAQYFSDYFHNK